MTLKQVRTCQNCSVGLYAASDCHRTESTKLRNARVSPNPGPQATLHDRGGDSVSLGGGPGTGLHRASQLCSAGGRHRGASATGKHASCDRVQPRETGRQQGLRAPGIVFKYILTLFPKRPRVGRVCVTRELFTIGCLRIICAVGSPLTGTQGDG